jgi:predicted peroxiredoxin
MTIGILVNTNKHLDAIVGIAKAAPAKGHKVDVFVMDDGTKLLANPEFSGLCKLSGVKMSFCDHSAKELGSKTEGMPEEIICGSQFNNANMNHESDRTLVL